MQKMYTYGTYGLGIHSFLPLPELTPLAEVKQDVVIRTGRIDWSGARIRGQQSWYEFSPGAAYLFWERVGTFLIREGKEIIFDPLPNVAEQLIRLPLLGTVLAVLLHQRGLLVLHASAIEVNGSAVAFIGSKGSGKSTTAAILYSRGHRLLADDVVAINVNESGRQLVMPGFPQFKLWPDAVASSLGDDPETLPELVCGQPKRARRIIERFSPEPVPLRCVYALSDGPVPELKPLQPQESFLQLIAHSYVGRFGPELLNGAGAALHLRQCASLLKHVPVLRLERPNLLKLLSATAILVEDQLESIQCGGAVANASSSLAWTAR